jgi:hypothetical protein
MMENQMNKLMVKTLKLKNACVLAALLVAGNASAVSVTPGMTGDLYGTTVLDNADLAGEVIRDQLLPFQVVNNIGTLLVQGYVQDRVVRSDNTGELIFAPRLRDLSSPSGTAWISGFAMTHYEGFSTDVDYRSDSLGDVGANRVSRDADGGRLFFSYDPSLLLPPDEGLFLSVATDAQAYDLSGMFTIYAQNDFGADVYSTQLLGVAAPSAVPLPAAAWLFATGLVGMIGFMRRSHK